MLTPSLCCKNLTKRSKIYIWIANDIARFSFYHHTSMFSNSWTTSAGWILIKQFVWLNWQVRLKQGEQGSARYRKRACGLRGRVHVGEVEPKTASWGRCSAAMMCILPESLLSNNFALDSNATSCGKLERPHQFSTPDNPWAIFSPLAWSTGVPRIRMDSFHFWDSWAATSW